MIAWPLVMPKSKNDEVTEIANRIANANQADLIILNARIERGLDQSSPDRDMIRRCVTGRRRPNVMLFLVTEGGDADAAYRIARALQDNYKKFTLCVSGYCKSAGTLLALGAHELAFAQNGELGPLDVQMAKKDELWESESGLTVTSALAALRDEALAAFETFFLSVTSRSQGRITVYTASEMAVDLAEGLFAPITAQIDPMHVGEAWRSMAIGREYGRRLIFRGRNFEPEGLDRLVSRYPSHSFVIDREEAKTLFRNVRNFTDDETALQGALGDAAEVPMAVPLLKCLSEEPKETQDNATVDGQEAVDEGKPRGPRPKPRRDVKSETTNTAEAGDSI